jgi:CDP-diacylglycerol--serine O-phosphatidyltransferase
MKNKWIGIWDYTVILTYCSLVTAVVGIIVSLSGKGHPYVGALLLLLCGLFDTFDGKVARTKKNRTEMEKQYGIQIDSLADLVAFGVFPICIGFALYRRDLYDIQEIDLRSRLAGVPMWMLVVVSALFVLCALIRLAYFNVTVEETQGSGVDEKIYWGLPVTITSLILPSYLLIRHAFYVHHINISWVYFVLIIIIAILFIRKFKLKKPGNSLIYWAIAVGAIEFIAVIVVWAAGITG